MLGANHTVTITASDVDATEQIYSKYLGFQTVAKSNVSGDLAASWGAPAAAGQRQLVMQPESGELSFLRFVEGGAMADYRPLTTYGWNSTEIVVQDLYALNDRLLDSPFEIIGAPAALEFEGLDMISAMQVVSPSKEVLYLTQISGPVPGFELPEAKSFVGRVFITILSGKSIEQISAFFKNAFGVSTAEPGEGVIRVVNKAQDLPSDHKTTISTISLTKQNLIEVDAWPADTTSDRRKIDGHLPPAQAIVTFEHENLDALSVPFITPPQARNEPPYNGSRAATLVGSTGELIELIETD